MMGHMKRSSRTVAVGVTPKEIPPLPVSQERKISFARSTPTLIGNLPMHFPKFSLLLECSEPVRTELDAAIMRTFSNALLSFDNVGKMKIKRFKPKA